MPAKSMKARVPRYKLTAEMKEFTKRFRKLKRIEKVLRARLIPQLAVTQELGQLHQQVTQAQQGMMGVLPQVRVDELVGQEAPEGGPGPQTRY